MEMNDSDYKKYAERRAAKSNLTADCAKAFLVGGSVSPRNLAGLFLYLYEFACGSLAKRASLRRVVSCVHVSAYGASPFLFHNTSKL